MSEFTLNLGNGIFLDSSGKLTGDVSATKASFALSQPLPISGSALLDAFAPTGFVVPQVEELAGALVVKNLDFLKSIGFTEELATTFGLVAGVATTLAAAIPYVNIAVALVSIISALFGKGGGNGLESLFKQECDRLHQHLDKIQYEEYLTFVGNHLSNFDKAINAVADYKSVVEKPKKYRGPGELEAKLHAAQTALNDLRLGDLMRYHWNLPMHPHQYFWYRGGRLQVVFRTVPESGPEQPVPLPYENDQNATISQLDHRPMVQLLLYGIQAYLTLIKTVVPEYRTTGQFEGELQTLAALLDGDEAIPGPLQKIRSGGVARTFYYKDFPWWKVTPRQLYRLAVGAMDLRSDTDDFMLGNSRPTDHPEWERMANVYEGWTTSPAIDPRGTQVEVDGDDWWTINPAAVDLANAQAERDYAAVLARSGYFSLLHLQALMRHLATEPDQSETVTGTAETWRKPLPTISETITNDKIPFSDPISATVTREPQEGKAFITLTTQRVPNDKAIAYRVRLMTLRDGNVETPFSSYVWTEYIPVGEHRNWQLQIHEDPSSLLNPVNTRGSLLADGISSPETYSYKNSVKLAADTFRWYVPVSDNPIKVEQIREGVKLFGPAFKPAPNPAPPPIGGEPGISRWEVKNMVTKPAGIGGFGWEEGDLDGKGEKREWERKEVELDYEVYWREAELTVSLKARPEDRNFLVYVVVEELLNSQQWLRTPIPVRMNGELLYVPQSFFDAEAKARKHANDMLGRIARNYSISRQPGPADPVVGGLRPGGLRSDSEMQEFLTLVRRHAPDIVEHVVTQDKQRARGAAAE